MNIATGLSVLTAMAFGTLLTHMVAQRSRAAAPVWVSFWVHVLASVALYDIVGLHDDAAAYDEIAQGYVAFWNHQAAFSPNFTVGKEGWVLVLAGIYFAFGHVPMVGLILNAGAGAITTSLVMGATARLGRPDMAKAAGWLSLLPSFLWWGSMLLRESLAWMLTAAMLWGALGIAAKLGRLNVVVLLMGFTGMLWIRGTVAVVLIAGIALGVIASTKRIPPVLFAGALGLVALGGPLVTRAFTLAGGAKVETLNASRASLSTANSGFETTGYSDPMSLVLALPSTFPRALLGPFPWELPFLPITALAEMVVWLFLLGLACQGWRRHPQARLVCVIPAVCFLLTLGATSGNYGTLVRLRGQAAVLMIPLAAIGWRRGTVNRQPGSRARYRLEAVLDIRGRLLNLRTDVVERDYVATVLERLPASSRDHLRADIYGGQVVAVVGHHDWLHGPSDQPRAGHPVT